MAGRDAQDQGTALSLGAEGAGSAPRASRPRPRPLSALLPGVSGWEGGNGQPAPSRMVARGTGGGTDTVNTWRGGARLRGGMGAPETQLGG